MENKWIEASQLPEGDKVYLKKDMFGWRVIAPWKKEDGSIDWFNFIFGGKRNLAFLIFILILIGLLLLGVNELISAYKEVASNPCGFCRASPISNLSYLIK